MVPETTENYALLQCQEQERQYGCCVASHSWQSEHFHALPILPGCVHQPGGHCHCLTRGQRGGGGGISEPFQPDTGWVGVLAPELRLRAQPEEQHKAFAQEQADTGQDFCLMYCQAKKLLWEVKFFYGR